jgi:hypothetical protein
MFVSGKKLLPTKSHCMGLNIGIIYQLICCLIRAYGKKTKTYIENSAWEFVGKNFDIYGGKKINGNEHA